MHRVVVHFGHCSEHASCPRYLVAGCVCNMRRLIRMALTVAGDPRAGRSEERRRLCAEASAG
eukprot:364496-Chlamydomonas_euryale.AAC.23